MKKSRFSEEQIAYALRMAVGGTPIVDVCRPDRQLRGHALHVEVEMQRAGRERVTPALVSTRITA